jgi:hypothetical protein
MDKYIDKEKTYHHADFISLVAIYLNSVVEHKIHELVETPQNTYHNSVGIELDCTITQKNVTPPVQERVKMVKKERLNPKPQ